MNESTSEETGMPGQTLPPAQNDTPAATDTQAQNDTPAQIDTPVRYDSLNLHPDLARAVQEAGYETCMPVQAATFPLAFDGRDMYAQSQTGTGKTAAFLISIFQRMMTIPSLSQRKTLIIAPTRELAVQIEGEARKLAKHLPVSIGCFYGGVAYAPQEAMLRDNVQMIIGTPGRIIDLVKQGKMLLREVGFLVVDEADRMFDMGFIDDLRMLLRYLPPPAERQTFLYSATLNFRIKNLAWEYMQEPHEIAIEPETVTVEQVIQELYHVGSDEKMPVLLGLLAREKPQGAIIFCNQKFVAEEIARRLGINGIECEYIMGDLPQSKRLQVIDRLKAGKISVLVATDVAARGLDVSGLDLVVNYDLPLDAESYVHRIGRTARAGAAGKAISLACEKFVYGLPAIEKYLGMKIPVCMVNEDLMFEDKSRNLRFSGSHSHSRSRSGGDHQRRGQKPGTDRRSGERSGERGRGRGRPDGRSEGRFEARTGRPGRGRPEAQDAREAPRRQADQAERGSQGTNPYAMSSEERMRMYKQKYSGGSAKAQKAEQGGGRRSEQAGDRPGKAKPSGQDRQQGRGQNAQGRNGGRRPAAQGSQAQASAAKPARARPASDTAAKAQPTAKPGRRGGLLDAIKLLLRKNKP